MAVKVVCDFCDKPLDFEDGRYVFYRSKMLGKYSSPGTSYLCKNCAEKLDEILEEMMPMVLENTKNNAQIMENNSKINQVRREELGSKG